MVSSMEVCTCEQLTSEINKLNEENSLLKSKIYVVEMDTDLARRTVSEYAEEVVKIQKKFRMLTESIHFLCTQDGMQHNKKIDLIKFEIEMAVNKKEGFLNGR